jgi:hypothetical protein
MLFFGRATSALDANNEEIMETGPLLQKQDGGCAHR